MRCYNLIMNELNLNAVFLELKHIAQNAFGPRNLKEYAAQYNMDMQSAQNWKFALRADDIIEQKLHPNVIGCTGRARVFSKLATAKGLEHKIILTARADMLARLYNAKLRGEKLPNTNGHQVVGIIVDSKMRMFDPAARNTAPVAGDVFVGRRFQFDFATDEYVIVNILSPDEYDKIKSHADLMNAYAQNLNQIFVTQNI